MRWRHPRFSGWRETRERKGIQAANTRAFMLSFFFQWYRGKTAPKEHTHTDTEARRAPRARGSLYQSCHRGRKKLLLITAEFLLICHVLTTKEGAFEGKLIDSLCNAGKQIESRQPSSKHHLPSLWSKPHRQSPLLSASTPQNNLKITWLIPCARNKTIPNFKMFSSV